MRALTEREKNNNNRKQPFTPISDLQPGMTFFLWGSAKIIGKFSKLLKSIDKSNRKLMSD